MLHTTSVTPEENHYPLTRKIILTISINAILVSCLLAEKLKTKEDITAYAESCEIDDLNIATKELEIISQLLHIFTEVETLNGGATPLTRTITLTHSQVMWLRAFIVFQCDALRDDMEMFQKSSEDAELVQHCYEWLAALVVIYNLLAGGK